MAQPLVDLSVLVPPFKEIRLPSAGYYPGIPEVVHVRGMLVRELKQLTSGRNLDGATVDAVISQCIKEPIAVNSLPVEDYNVILLHIRLASQGPKATGTHTCSTCRSKYKLEYDLTEAVNIEYADRDLPLVRPFKMNRLSEAFGADVIFDIRQLTRGDILKMEASMMVAKDNAARTGQPMDVYPMEEFLKVQISKVHGLGPIPLPASQIVNYLTEDDADEMLKAFDDVSMKVTGQVTTTCPICTAKSDYEVPFTDLFFR